MSENNTMNQALHNMGQIFGLEDPLPELKLPQKQGSCDYCDKHKEFSVMDGYFMAKIIGDKLHFELGEFADPYEVSEFDIDLGFCPFCGKMLAHD